MNTVFFSLNKDYLFVPEKFQFILNYIDSIIIISLTF
jgi:hypothetical protein